MDNNATYDCVIIGGGIAGLCLAIKLRQKNYSVVLLEKNKYPFHKVCGEYVSNESYNFLKGLGLPLQDWALPNISEFGISSRKGFMLNAELGMGGFGISRYKLDHELYLLAKKVGVNVLESTKVTAVKQNMVSTIQGDFNGRLIIGAFGKSSSAFAKANRHEKNNYIGVKYHVRTNFPTNRIELHLFRKGYAGISKIEDDLYCLCYLSHSDNLRESGNSIPVMEKDILSGNPFLKKDPA